MIKYFYFEKHYINSKYIIKNEKVLHTIPSNIFVRLVNGFMLKTDEYKGRGMYEYYIDVEKRIEYIGSLDDEFQEVYDKLLMEQRNNKLETLL